MPAEVSTNLARFDGVRYGLSKKGASLLDDYGKTRGEGFGAEARRRIMLGTYVLSAGYYDAYYGKALAARRQLSQEFASALTQVGAVVLPRQRQLQRQRLEKNQTPFPCIFWTSLRLRQTLPATRHYRCRWGRLHGRGKNLPVGIQFTAAHGDEQALFAIGKDLESA